MNRDVFISLLALDSYNRGYGQKVNTDGNSIGSAQIINRLTVGVDAEKYSSWQSAGFYAIAYEWNGETIISYRGTNFPESFSLAELASFLAEDFGGGWDIFTGIGNGSHARLARGPRQETLH
jgi:hypothetical protein